MKLLPSPSERPSPWVFNPAAMTLELHKGGHQEPVYDVDLERCRTPAEVLDWIMHIQGKHWASDEVLAGLVRSLWDCLGSKICFGEGDKRPVNIKALIRERMRSAPRSGGGPTVRQRRSRKQATD